MVRDESLPGRHEVGGACAAAALALSVRAGRQQAREEAAQPGGLEWARAAAGLWTVARPKRARAAAGLWAVARPKWGCGACVCVRG
jgi:hypothetical protein